MSQLPGKKRPYQDHLRYKHMVARLQGLPVQQLENALLQEIAKGRRWRIDAALEAAVDRFQQLDMLRVAGDIGRFGCLTAATRISAIIATLDVKPGVRPVVADNVHSQMFAQALNCGHLRVAGYAAAQKASLHKIADNPRKVGEMVAARDARKIALLARTKYTFEAVTLNLARTNDAAALSWLIDTAKIKTPALNLLLSRAAYMRPAPEAVKDMLVKKGAVMNPVHVQRQHNIDQLVSSAVKDIAQQSGAEIEKMKNSGDKGEELAANLMESMLKALGGSLTPPQTEQKPAQGKTPANKNSKQGRKPPKAG